MHVSVLPVTLDIFPHDLCFLFRRSIGKKLSSLLYTSGEDLDWSEMGLDRDEDVDVDQDEDTKKAPEDHHHHHHQNSNPSALRHSASPPPVREETESSQSSSKDENSQPEWASSGVQNWTQVIRQDAPKRAVSSPVVTYTQKINESESKQQQPQVRRKSSELSTTMRSRLQAFNSQETISSSSGSAETEVRQTTAGPIEPDQQFHKKLLAFRKISEGSLEKPKEMKPKPPMSISSLLGGVSSKF